jgi:hypothetical protein
VRWRDWLLAIGVSFVLADAFDALIHRAIGPGVMALPGVPMPRLLLPGVAIAAVVLLARDWRGALERARAAWFLWPVIGLTFLSAVWSEHPRTTLLWAAALLGTSLFGLALAVRFSVAAQAALTLFVAAVLALGSIAWVLLWTVRARVWGEWRGLYVSRNLLGKFMALGVTAALAVAPASRRRAAVAAGLLSCGVVLAATGSRASQLCALVAAITVLLLLAPAACRGAPASFWSAAWWRRSWR